MLIVAESAFLVSTFTHKPRGSRQVLLEAETGVYALADDIDLILPSYEGVVRGAMCDSESAAASIALASDHVITWECERGKFVAIDGAQARSGGMQHLNDHRGSGREHDVEIRRDRTCARTNTQLVPVRPDMDLTEMARAELLTDYQGRFWQTRQGGSAMLAKPMLEYKPRPRLVQRSVDADMVGALAHAHYVGGACETSTAGLDGDASG